MRLLFLTFCVVASSTIDRPPIPPGLKALQRNFQKYKRMVAKRSKEYERSSINDKRYFDYVDRHFGSRDFDSRHYTNRDFGSRHFDSRHNVNRDFDSSSSTYETPIYNGTPIYNVTQIKKPTRKRLDYFLDLLARPVNYCIKGFKSLLRKILIDLISRPFTNQITN